MQILVMALHYTSNALHPWVQTMLISGTVFCITLIQCHILAA